MRLIGVLAQDETPAASEAQNCLVALNQLLDGWDAERLNVYKITEARYQLNGAKQSYQIGPGAADFNAARPVLIQTASIILPNSSVRNPMDLLSAVDWAAVPERALTGELPRKLYCDYAFPIATLNVSPIPSGNPQIELFSWMPLPLFVLLTDLVTFPPAYAKAIRYNLAVNIAPEFGVPVDQSIAAIALGEKDVVRKFNAGLLSGAVGQATTAQIPNVGVPQPVPNPQQ